MNGLTELAISGPLLLATVLALAAGAVSFASPCSLPLVPGYLAYLAGLSGTAAPATAGSDAAGSGSGGGGQAVATRTGRARLVVASLLFVGGFTAVFTAAIMGVLGLSDFLLVNGQVLQRVGGVVTIAMGRVFLGLVPVRRFPRPCRRRRTSSSATT